MKYIIIGFIVGIIINKIVIRPIERWYWRKKYFNEWKSALIKDLRKEGSDSE